MILGMVRTYVMSLDNASLMNLLAVSCGVSWALCARAGLGKQRASFACALCGASAHIVTKRNERGKNTDRLSADRYAQGKSDKTEQETCNTQTWRDKDRKAHCEIHAVM